MGSDAPRKADGMHLVPWSPGERTRRLLDAVSIVHSARSVAEVESAAVDAI